MNTPKRLERLHKLMALARAEERRQMQALAGCLNALADSRRRALELIQYRDTEQPAALARRRVCPVFIDARHFFLKLDTAIQQQGRTVDRMERDRDAAQARWARAHRRVELLQKLIDKTATDRRRQQEFAERKNFDEIAQTMHSARKR